jgi:integration host factor subunit alpha
LKSLTHWDNQGTVTLPYLEDWAGMKGATVTRADLCEAVHEEVGLTRQDCGELVERVLELMAVALEKGQQVKLSGFGVFQVRAKRARMGRNPKTGEPAAIEPRRVIGFRASQVMKARVDKALAR